jgi:hypothetical protein
MGGIMVKEVAIGMFLPSVMGTMVVIFYVEEEIALIPYANDAFTSALVTC